MPQVWILKVLFPIFSLVFPQWVLGKMFWIYLIAVSIVDSLLLSNNFRSSSQIIFHFLRSWSQNTGFLTFNIFMIWLTTKNPNFLSYWSLKQNHLNAKVEILEKCLQTLEIIEKRDACRKVIGNTAKSSNYQKGSVQYAGTSLQFWSKLKIVE